MISFGRDYRRGERLSRSFAATLAAELLGQRPDASPSGRTETLVGLEHEYRLLDGTSQVDFRQVIRSLALSQPYLDPGDPYAYRISSGAVVTCDQAEAEVVLPPTTVQPQFTRQIDAAAAFERGRLLDRLPASWSADGYSTHISVAIPSGSGDRLARLYARTFAPALMLLMDRRDSPGLLVRPRPGRLELCGEFVDAIYLRSAVAFAVGSVSACLATLVTQGCASPVQLPAALEATITGAHQRYGWYVRRDAFGCDLYTSGRPTVLATIGGGHVTAQQQLTEAWTSARRALSALGVAPGDLDATDRIVTGAIPLPSEIEPSPVADVVATEEPAGSAPENEFGNMLQPRRRPAYEVAPVMATWDLSVFVVASRLHQRIAFASVPRVYLRSFLAALDGERLDDLLTDYLELRSSRRLARRRAAAPGLWDSLPGRRSLLAPERPPEPTAAAA